MKGIAVDCLKEVVVGSLGPAKWIEILARAGVESGTTFHVNDDVDDQVVLNLFAQTCDVGNLTLEQACDAFGAHWVGTYIPQRYPEFYAGVRTAREFLLKLDGIHAAARQRIPNAQPPRHSYEWKSDNTLVMGYASDRGLVELFIGAVRGAARHFGDAIEVQALDEKRVEIVFL